MNIEIDSPPPDSVAIRMDNVGHLPAIEDGPWKQVCDYLLIADESAVSYAVFIELKRTLHGDNKPMDQLLRSLPILEYLYSICTVARRISPREPQVSVHMPLSIHFWIAAEKFAPRADKQSARRRPPKSESRISYCGATFGRLVEPVVSFSRLVAAGTQTRMDTRQ